MPASARCRPRRPLTLTKPRRSSSIPVEVGRDDLAQQLVEPGGPGVVAGALRRRLAMSRDSIPRYRHAAHAPCRAPAAAGCSHLVSHVASPPSRPRSSTSRSGNDQTNRSTSSRISAPPWSPSAETVQPRRRRRAATNPDGRLRPSPPGTDDDRRRAAAAATPASPSATVPPGSEAQIAMTSSRRR